MKKIIVGWVVVLLLTVTVFRIDSAELIKSVKVTGPNKNVVKEEIKTEKKSEKNFKVRIIILDFESKNKCHSQVTLDGKGMKVYSGEKFSKKEETEYLKINANSKLFKKNNVVKVESKRGIVIRNNPNGKITYHGSFYIYKENTGIVLVNQVELEKYVAGVISSEIGVKAPKEAMKAQAICARTYITNAKAKEYKKYDAEADDSTDYQVYNRIAPNKDCFGAAEDTKNMIMTYKGKPITAYYFSTSCGYTTDYKIWGREKLPYLSGCKVAEQWSSEVRNFDKYIRGKGDGYEKNDPYFRWTCYLSAGQIENSIYLLTGVNIGHFERAEVNARGKGGIASQITIYGDQRQVVVNNQLQIRKMLSSVYMVLKLQDGTEKTGLLMLPSAFITMDTVYNDRVVSGLKIYGGGFGHGSGMSQNGAIEMAKKGKNYKEILNKFYNKIRIQKRTGL